MEGEMVVMQEIFRFDRQGVDEEGRVIGAIGATGIRPNFAEKLRLAGTPLPADLFARGGL
jgi:pilus assembly protein CpaF